MVAFNYLKQWVSVCFPHNRSVKNLKYILKEHKLIFHLLNKIRYNYRDKKILIKKVKIDLGRSQIDVLPFK